MSETPEDGSASLTSSGYEDGLGRRTLSFDRETGGVMERLLLRPELGSFEPAIAARVEQAGTFDDERFARPYGVERDSAGGRVTVVSEYLQGNRLSDLLEGLTDDPSEVQPAPGLEAAMGFLLEVLPALGALHATLGFAHGAVGAGRIAITPAGQVVLLDWIYGDVLARLRWSQRRLWRELGVAAPPGGGVTAFDAAGDVAQAALTALAFVTGRTVRVEQAPDGLAAVLPEIVEIAHIRGGEAFGTGVQRFLQRALPLPGSRPFPGAEEAGIAVRQIAREIGLSECRAALAVFVAEGNRARAAGRAGERSTAPLVVKPDLPAEPLAEGSPAAASVHPLVELSLDEKSPEPPLDEVSEPVVPVLPMETGPASPPADPPEPMPLEPTTAPHVAPPAPILAPPAPVVAPPPAPILAPPAPVLAPLSPVLESVTPTPAPEPLPVPQPASQPPLVAESSWQTAFERVAALPVASERPPMPYYPPVGDLPEPPTEAWTRSTPTSVLGAQIEPEPIAAPVRRKPFAAASDPSLGGLRDPEPGTDLTGVPFVHHGSGSPPRSRWPVAAAAGVVVVILAGVAGWTYLGGTPQPQPGPAAAAPAPATSKAVPVSSGALSLETKPSGAKVLLDGVAAGETPLTLPEVAAGRHTVTFVTASGTVKKTIRVEAGQTASLDVPVFAGWVAVFAPVVMDIAEDGRSIGTTEGGRVMLAPGRHQLTFTNREFGYSASQAVDIAPGEERSINLQPTGTLNLNALPWAEVWIDGKKVGDTPIAGLKVPLGTHDVVFRHPQLGERSMTTMVRASGTAAASVDFSKTP